MIFCSIGEEDNHKLLLFSECDNSDFKALGKGFKHLFKTMDFIQISPNDYNRCILGSYHACEHTHACIHTFMGKNGMYAINSAGFPLLALSKMSGGGFLLSPGKKTKPKKKQQKNKQSYQQN